jgi:hypothetical protein
MTDIDLAHSVWRPVLWHEVPKRLSVGRPGPERRDGAPTGEQVPRVAYIRPAPPATTWRRRRWGWWSPRAVLVLCFDARPDWTPRVTVDVYTCDRTPPRRRPSSQPRLPAHPAGHGDIRLIPLRPGRSRCSSRNYPLAQAKSSGWPDAVDGPFYSLRRRRSFCWTGLSSDRHSASVAGALPLSPNERPCRFTRSGACALVENGGRQIVRAVVLCGG